MQTHAARLSGAVFIVVMVAPVTQSILDGKALGLIVGLSSTILLSNPDDFDSIYVQDHESACGMLILGSAIELYMHHLAWDKACLRWQTYLA